jgi:hypothetical protein
MNMVLCRLDLTNRMQNPAASGEQRRGLRPGGRSWSMVVHRQVVAASGWPDALDRASAGLWSL